jgi:hypothetical protein
VLLDEARYSGGEYTGLPGTGTREHEDGTLEMRCGLALGGVEAGKRIGG